MEFYMGVDVGGTFTDGVVIDEEGHPYTFKTPTTPEDTSIGFMNCIRRTAEVLGLSSEEFLLSLAKLTYGTTSATNALLEGHAAKTGLIMTRGFRDTLPI